MNQPPLVQTIVTGLDLLDVIAQNQERGLTITELCGEMGMHKSTVYRMLHTLNLKKYVDKDAQGRYRLGIKLFELGSVVANSMDLRQIAHPVIEQLGEETGEVVHLGLLEQGELVYIDKVESKHTIRLHSRVGARAPAYCTGVGKAVLAFLPEDQLDQYLRERQLLRYTETTLASEAELRAELTQVRGRGYALDNEEHMPGVTCVAAPIRQHSGEVIAAVSVTAPFMRMSEERVASLIPQVVAAAEEISRRLGHKNKE